VFDFDVDAVTFAGIDDDVDFSILLFDIICSFFVAESIPFPFVFPL
jgi:hypothetical protein